MKQAAFMRSFAENAAENLTDLSLPSVYKTTATAKNDMCKTKTY